MLHITIAFNHRILDGSVASEILAEMKRIIEDENYYKLIGDGHGGNCDGS